MDRDGRRHPGNRLDEETIDALTVGDPSAEPRLPAHVELGARIHATNVQALDEGDYRVTVAPARSIGTFTSRFTTITTGSSLEDVYAAVPTTTDGARPVQLSFPPAYPHAENICRVPAYLPHVLSLGEHRGCDDTTITLDDLAVTATREGLHLVSLSRMRVIEPQVFHGLALEKQPPPLARFLIHLSRGMVASWHTFDWGPHTDRLPFLPRVRYGRAILAPARWRVTSDELPRLTQNEWSQALNQWRARWGCPDTVELADDDRSLRLNLNEPAHATILHQHLKRHGHATLTETAEPTEYGWAGGHAHDIVLPLDTTHPKAPSPLAADCPLVSNSSHGHLPGSSGTRWLNAKIHTHPDRLDELITEHLPQLLDTLGGDPDYWFIRYRSPHETDHLRLRLHTPTRSAYTECTDAVGGWAQQLRREGAIHGLAFDTYRPEIGRYGRGAAMEAAERVFVADSRAVAAQLRHLPGTVLSRDALVAVNMIATIEGFFADTEYAMRWLTTRPAPAATTGRALLNQVVDLAAGASTVRELLGWDDAVPGTWRARADALAAYRTRLPTGAAIDTVVESLLHMHHNRASGIDRSREAACRRLARRGALAWTARYGEAR